MDYSRFRQTSAASTAQINEGLRSYMLRIYNYMGAGLAVTGFVAFMFSQTPALLSLIYHVEGGAVGGYTMFGWLVAFSPLIMALALNVGINRMQLSTLHIMYWAFAVLMGMSLSSLFLMFTGESLTRVFFITATMFGGMSLWGYTTKKDLAGFGSFLVMGVWGLIAASIINIFMQSTALHFAVSVLAVIIFTGLTAYDTQRLKQLYFQVAGSGEALARVSLMGALSLYIDFINIFIHLLQLVGDRR